MIEDHLLFIMIFNIVMSGISALVFQYRHGKGEEFMPAIFIAMYILWPIYLGGLGIKYFVLFLKWVYK